MNDAVLMSSGSDSEDVKLSLKSKQALGMTDDEFPTDFWAFDIIIVILMCQINTSPVVSNVFDRTQNSRRFLTSVVMNWRAENGSLAESPSIRKIAQLAFLVFFKLYWPFESGVLTRFVCALMMVPILTFVFHYVHDYLQDLRQKSMPNCDEEAQPPKQGLQKYRKIAKVLDAKQKATLTSVCALLNDLQAKLQKHQEAQDSGQTDTPEHLLLKAEFDFKLRFITEILAPVIKMVVLRKARFRKQQLLLDRAERKCEEDEYPNLQYQGYLNILKDQAVQLVSD